MSKHFFCRGYAFNRFLFGIFVWEKQNMNVPELEEGGVEDGN